MNGDTSSRQGNDHICGWNLIHNHNKRYPLPLLLPSLLFILFDCLSVVPSIGKQRSEVSRDKPRCHDERDGHDNILGNGPKRIVTVGSCMTTMSPRCRPLQHGRLCCQGLIMEQSRRVSSVGRIASSWNEDGIQESRSDAAQQGRVLLLLPVRKGVILIRRCRSKVGHDNDRCGLVFKKDEMGSFYAVGRTTTTRRLWWWWSDNLVPLLTVEIVWSREHASSSGVSSYTLPIFWATRRQFFRPCQTQNSREAFLYSSTSTYVFCIIEQSNPWMTFGEVYLAFRKFFH